jgi:hypothetical protein
MEYRVRIEVEAVALNGPLPDPLSTERTTDERTPFSTP